MAGVRGGRPKWIAPAQEVLSDRMRPCHSNEVLDGIRAIRDDEESKRLAGTTLYTSMLQSPLFVRIAGRPSVFGLSGWYEPSQVLSRVNAYLTNPHDTNLKTFGIPREAGTAIRTSGIQCAEFLSQAQTLAEQLIATSAERVPALEELDDDTVLALLDLASRSFSQCGDADDLERRLNIEASRLWPEIVAPPPEPVSPTPEAEGGGQQSLERRIALLEERERLRQDDAGSNMKDMIAELEAANTTQLQETKNGIVDQFTDELAAFRQELDQSTRDLKTSSETMQGLVTTWVPQTAEKAAERAAKDAIEDSKKSWITWLLVGVIFAFLLGVAAGVAGNAVTEVIRNSAGPSRPSTSATSAP